MAKNIGTAADLEDLFSKIVSFLTTNPSLVASGQAWQVLRLHRDNLVGLTSNLTESSGSASYRRMIHTCRYDSRSLNTDNPYNALAADFFASNAVMGTSFIRLQLRQAVEVRTVRLHAPSNSYVSYMLRNFRLQYSDNGSTWTTALTVNNAPAFSTGEWRDYAVPGTPKAHSYWRVLIDSVQGGGANVSWASLLLLAADGSVANHFGSEVIFKAPGLAGSDEIFVGIRSEYAAAEGWYNLFLNGYSGFDPNEPSWFNQPGALPGPGAAYPLAVPMVPCWNAPMPFWMAASGRSFRFAVKVSTSYEGGYLGFILPYAMPNQYPYPLAVGGSLVPNEYSRSAEWRYSYVDYRHGVYPGPGANYTPNGEGRWATLYLHTPNGEWRYLANRPNTGSAANSTYGPDQSLSAPYVPSGAWRSVWPHCMNDQWNYGRLAYRECLGGGYMPQPCILLQRAPVPMVFGELEGTYVISGYQNAAENLTSIDSKSAVIFQNTYRTTPHEFWALTLED